MNAETKAKRKPFWIKLLLVLLLLLVLRGILILMALRETCPTQVSWNGEAVAAPLIVGSAEPRRDGTRIAVNCSILDRSVYQTTVYVWKDEVCLDPAGTSVRPILTAENRIIRHTFDTEPGADYRICLDMKTGHGLRYLYCLTPTDNPAPDLQLVDVLDAATGEYLYSIQEQQDGRLIALTRTPTALPTAG